MIDTTKPYIERFMNDKGNTALATCHWENGNCIVSAFISNNSRIKSLKSFNHSFGAIAQYSNDAWKDAIEKYIIDESKKLG